MTDSLENHITAAKEGNQRAFSACWMLIGAMYIIFN